MKIQEHLNGIIARASVSSGVVGNLTEKMSNEVNAELLATQIAHMQEEQLFYWKNNIGPVTVALVMAH